MSQPNGCGWEDTRQSRTDLLPVRVLSVQKPLKVHLILPTSLFRAQNLTYSYRA